MPCFKKFKVILADIIKRIIRIPIWICLYVLYISIGIPLIPFRVLTDNQFRQISEIFGQKNVKTIVEFVADNYRFIEYYRILCYICDEQINSIFNASLEYRVNAEDIRSKIVVITDGGSKYGSDIARVMSENGAKVIIGYKTRTSDVQQSGGHVWTIHLDMTKLESVKTFARQVSQLFPGQPIDIIILNACFLSETDTREVTEEFERHFTANHLSNLIIINALRDRLNASENARVVIESSASHIFGNIEFEDVNLIRNYTIMKAYLQSKLANVLLAHSIAQQTSGIKAFSVNPGCSESELRWRHNNTGLPYIQSLLYKLFDLVCNRSQYSIHTTLFCALDASVGRHSGGYFSNCQRIYIDIIDEMAKKLLDESDNMLEYQRKLEILNDLLIT